MRIQRAQLDEMIRHAQDESPREACGLLPGRDGEVTRVVRGQNVAANPLVRYQLEPQQQLAAFNDMEARGEAMLAIYHSHPFSPAYPSRVDLDMAYYLDSAYVIVSLRDPARPEVRAFRIGAGGTIDDEELTVQPTETTGRT